MTIEQFLTLPPVDDVRHELDEGKLLTTPLPLPRHQRIVSRLSRKLADFVDWHSLGEVFPAGTPFVLGRDPDTLRGPDITFLRGERVALIDEDQAIEGSADLTVEVISPDDTLSQVLRKIRQYLEVVREGGRPPWPSATGASGG